MHPAPSTLRLKALVLLGLVALVFYFRWWFGGGAIYSWTLIAALVGAAAYHWTQLLCSWVIYWNGELRGEPPAPREDLTVDVFLPVYNEPFFLVEKCLAAACAMRGEHRTWLLDDANDPALKSLADRLGAGYLARRGNQHAKAGNVNAALEKTDADIVVIFDVDHVPQPEFLERSLGYFRDEEIGFVQVMLTYENADESWVARAAGESAIDFYNPTSVGMDGLGCATLIGSNALLRRSALDSIGGYRPGLAEDLATSIGLHAAGWKSAYVAEPLAPGLAPADLSSWFGQQLKWSRGVFEVLLKDYFRLFPKLSWGQRVSYAVRGTYYWIGLLIATHLVFTAAYLFGGDLVASLNFVRYLQHWIPLIAVSLLIRQAAMATWGHPSVGRGLMWRPFLLVGATWPVFVAGWLLTLLRVPIEYKPTPKAGGDQLNPWWVSAQLCAFGCLTGGIVYGTLFSPSPAPMLLIPFALLQASFQGVALVLAIQEQRPGRLRSALAGLRASDTLEQPAPHGAAGGRAAARAR